MLKSWIQIFAAVAAILATCTSSTEEPLDEVLLYFVHGLGSSSDIWLDFPEELADKVDGKIETQTFDYKSKKHNLFCFTSLLPWCERQPTLDEIAARLLTTIELERSGRPIVLVTHSLGGVVVADMMRQASERCAHCLERIKGIAFFSGPFRPNPVASVASALPNAPDVVQDLGKDDIDRIMASWRNAVNPDLPVACVWGYSDDVVGKADAHEPCSEPSRKGARQFTVEGDHNSLVGVAENFNSQSVDVVVSLYEKIVGELQDGQSNGDDCGYETVEVTVPPDYDWAKCEHSSFGIAGYNFGKEVTRSSGWRGGGGNQESYCAELAIAVIRDDPEVPSTATWETEDSGESRRWTVLRVRQYNYHCTLKFMWDPVFNSGRGVVCGPALPKVVTETRRKACGESRPAIDVESLKGVLIEVQKTLLTRQDLVYPAIEAYLEAPSQEAWDRVLSLAQDQLRMVRVGIEKSATYDAGAAIDLLTTVGNAEAHINPTFSTTRKQWNKKKEVFEEIQDVSGLPNSEQVSDWYSRLKELQQSLRKEISRVVAQNST